MKKFVFVFFMFFTVLLLGNDYEYNRTNINEQKFKKLFKEFSKILYTDGKKVYDLRIGNKFKFIENANVERKFSSKQDGKAEGVIYKIDDEKSFLLKVGSIVVYVTGNVDTSNLTEITKFSANLGHIGTYKYKKANGKEYNLQKCTVLKPITKELFKEYIKQRQLFRYKKIKETVPARKKLCPKCKGHGRYGYKNLPCNLCKRTGRVVASWKERISWKKEFIK